MIGESKIYEHHQDEVLISWDEYNNRAKQQNADTVIEIMRKFFCKEDFNPLQALETVLTHPQAEEIGRLIRDDEEVIFLFWKALLYKNHKQRFKLIRKSSFAGLEQLRILYHDLSPTIN